MPTHRLPVFGTFVTLGLVDTVRYSQQLRIRQVIGKRLAARRGPVRGPRLLI